MSRPRVAIVVTGSELVRGERTDLNGPFYAQEALRLGLQPSRLTIVGDDPVDLEAALREGVQRDVCLVSGGLGPTHDDRTIELVARVVGRALELDAALEQEIEQVSRRFAERMKRDYVDFAAGVRKQATLPAGAVSLGIAGTAPGVVLDTGSCVVVVLPGPPRELQELWPRALASEPMQRVLARTTRPSRRVARLYGVSESLVAKSLAEAGGDGDGVEVTICAREFEIHVDMVVEPGAEARADALEDAFLEPLGGFLFGRDERSVQELVLDACRTRGLTLGTAESCTGGLVAKRLTDVAGASDVFRGGIVAYENDVKERLLGVPASLLADHGAVSAGGCRHDGPRRTRTPRGRRRGLGHRHRRTGRRHSRRSPSASSSSTRLGPMGEMPLRVELPGGRDVIRARSAVAALHLLRRLL